MNTVDVRNFTALHVAAIAGKIKNCDLLLRNKADPCAVTENVLFYLLI